MVVALAAIKSSLVGLVEVGCFTGSSACPVSDDLVGCIHWQANTGRSLNNWAGKLHPEWSFISSETSGRQSNRDNTSNSNSNSNNNSNNITERRLATRCSSSTARMASRTPLKAMVFNMGLAT